jgi:hypothetical protein
VFKGKVQPGGDSKGVVEIFRGLGGVRHIQEAQKSLKDILK